MNGILEIGEACDPMLDGYGCSNACTAAIGFVCDSNGRCFRPFPTTPAHINRVAPSVAVTDLVLGSCDALSSLTESCAPGGYTACGATVEIERVNQSGTDLCAVWARNIVLPFGATQFFEGPHAVALIAVGDIDVLGSLEVRAGGHPIGCIDSSGNGIGGGGPGGSGRGRGGSGGAANSEGAPTVSGNALIGLDLVTNPLVGGCNGGAGGGIGAGAPGGLGGGAIQVSAAGTLTFSGTIFVDGTGGWGGTRSDMPDGGGGGGAGGAVLFEGDALSLGGAVEARGGGGGVGGAVGAVSWNASADGRFGGTGGSGTVTSSGGGGGDDGTAGGPGDAGAANLYAGGGGGGGGGLEDSRDLTPP